MSVELRTTGDMIGQSCYVSEVGNYLGRAWTVKSETELWVILKAMTTMTDDAERILRS